MVAVQDGEGRTAYVRRSVDAKPAGQSPDEKGFPCSQLADESNHVARIRESPYRFPQRPRLLRRGRVIYRHPVFHAKAGKLGSEEAGTLEAS